MQYLKIRTLIERMCRDLRGQDMVEYALLAAMVAISVGAILPGIDDKISTVFSMVSSVVVVAAA